MEERNCYVYEDYRIDNWTCCYVGMGSKNEENGYNRFEVAERNDHHDNIMNSCGIARVIIRDNLTRSEANALEEARIYYYVFVLGYTIDIKGYRKGKKNDSHLTNMTWGGDGTKGCKPSEETKKKMSEAKKGRNPYVNKTEEEIVEWKRKISEAWNNKTEEEKREIAKKKSEAHKGEKNPMYGRTGEKHPMFGKYHTEETRKKQSEAKQGEKHPMYGKHLLEETRKKLSEANSKKVRCIEENRVFNSLKEASEWCGMKGASNIAKQIQKRRKSAGKHPITGEKLHWEYVDEETIETNLNIFTSNITISL